MKSPAAVCAGPSPAPAVVRPEEDPLARAAEHVRRPARCPAPGGPGSVEDMERARAALAAGAVTACLPYLTLKLNWLAGGHLGIPEGSPLLDGGAALWSVNALTVAMDATVLLLVLALVRPFGQRLPGALLALPLWGAAGLLGPIAVAFPLQAVTGVLRSGGGSGDGDPGQLLEGWVWTLVYTGFTLQALALGGLFALYVRRRWGALLRSPLRTGATPGATEGAGAWAAFAVAVLAVLPAAVSHTDFALDSGGAGDRRIVEATFAAYTVLAVLGTARLLHSGTSRRARARLWPTLVTAGTASAVLACWGGWLLLGSLSGGGRTVGQHDDRAAEWTYAAQLLAGLLFTALLARALRRRAAARAARLRAAAPRAVVHRADAPRPATGRTGSPRPVTRQAGVPEAATPRAATHQAATPPAPTHQADAPRAATAQAAATPRAAAGRAGGAGGGPQPGSTPVSRR